MTVESGERKIKPPRIEDKYVIPSQGDQFNSGFSEIAEKHGFEREVHKEQTTRTVHYQHRKELKSPHDVTIRYREYGLGGLDEVPPGTPGNGRYEIKWGGIKVKVPGKYSNQVDVDNLIREARSLYPADHEILNEIKEQIGEGGIRKAQVAADYHRDRYRHDSGAVISVEQDIRYFDFDDEGLPRLMSIGSGIVVEIKETDRLLNFRLDLLKLIKRCGGERFVGK